MLYISHPLRFLGFMTVLFTFIFSISSAAKTYQLVEWPELIPKEDLDILLNPPDSIFEIEDGSKQDSLEATDQLENVDEAAEKYFAALKSLKVVPSFHNKSVKIPGFVVPLEADEDNKVTEFFIVPYFGACLHMPPPPPNQIIFAKVKEGFELESLHYPFWFEGNLLVSTNEHALGSSAYQLAIGRFYTLTRNDK